MEKQTNAIFTAEQLQGFMVAVFTGMGASETHAQLAAEVLLSADLSGIDSHGIARLSGYVRLWEAGRINMQPNIRVVRESLSAATVDGDAGLGLVVAAQAMDLAIEKAAVTGVGMVSVCNSNHFGIAAYHASRALKHQMIGMSMTNASPLVTPTFGKERMLGTNPHCWVFPAQNHPPVVIDMASAAAANGKLEIAEREGKKLPEGWALDAQGQPSTDPSILKKGGSLLPLGSTYATGSHKGYGMAAVADLLSGVLSGGNFGPWVPPFVAFLQPPADPVGQGLGHFLTAMRIDAFREPADYYQAIDTWISRFKQTAPADPQTPVRIHGEPEFETRLERQQHGIPLNQKVVDDLQVLAQRFACKL